jgi:hypothetical protein
VYSNFVIGGEVVEGRGKTWEAKQKEKNDRKKRDAK